ncbi:MAG: RebB family R body protein [Acidobacteriota bacterium]|nr:RebB family R body protein [Acidobacteriota bacterium]
MAEPTPVNPQITDSVSQVNTKVLGSTPALAVGNALQGMSHAAVLNMVSASQAFQNWAITFDAATVQAAGEVLAAVGVEVEDDFDGLEPELPRDHDREEVFFTSSDQDED